MCAVLVDAAVALPGVEESSEAELSGVVIFEGTVVAVAGVAFVSYSTTYVIFEIQ